MILKLVWENVRFRPVRTLLSILLIAVPVTLILTLVGMTNGFLEGSKERATGVGFDILFRPKNTTILTAAGAAALPEKFIAALAKEPHVAATTGVATKLIGGGFDTIFGIDEPSFVHLSGPFVFLDGHGLQAPDDILLDKYYADQRHVHVGQKIDLLNRMWNVAGIVEPGKLSHAFIHLSMLQDLDSATGKVSQIYIKLDNAANTKMVMDYLAAKYEDYPIYSMQDILSAYDKGVDSIPLLKTFTTTVVWIGVLIGFAVVSLSMYMAVLQRTREIGILKSLGASKNFVMAMILAESFALGLGGTIAGILLSFGTRAVMNSFMRASLPQAIVPGWWPIAGGIAVGGALLGALYPGMLAVRQDPIEALAYE